MLLESALADFSCDESQVLSQPIAFSWEELPSKPRSQPESECSGRISSVSSPERRSEVVVLKSSSSGYHSDEIHHLHSDRQYSGELISKLQRQYSGELLPNSRISGYGSSKQEILDTKRRSESLDLRRERDSSELYSRSYSDVSRHHRTLSSATDEKVMLDDTSFATAPVVWDTQPGRIKCHPSRNGALQHRRRSPARLTLIKECDQAECSNSSSPGSHRSTEKRQHVRKQGRGPSSVLSGSSTPQPHTHYLKVAPGDVIRISRIGAFETSKNHSRNDSYCSMDSEGKYYEDDSPVSTLEHLPSPTDVNDDRHKSAAGTSRRESTARPNSSASASSVTDTRISVDSVASLSSRDDAPRCLPSFNSSSLHSSAPAASNSSSSTFMASCLVALEVALQSDRDESDRQGGSFASHDSIASERHTDRSGRLLQSQSYHGGEHRRAGHRWAASHSQLEPEYHTMDFYSENGDDLSYSADRTNTEATASPRSIVSTLSAMSRPTSLRQRRSLDEYSWQDGRFSQDQSGVWLEQQDGSCSEDDSNSGRRQDVFWDDQQSDRNPERAEEVVRGAVDGLRFTYSPVSSAFVFTRPRRSQSSQLGNGELPEDRAICYSPPNTADTEISQRFSISLDYATSICSEDSLPYSYARSSDVTELGLSRAESWSKVARGSAAIAAQQHYHRELTSGWLDPRGHGRVVEEAGRGESETPDVETQNVGNAGSAHRKRSSKRATCLPFRSILRNLKSFSPSRSRLGPHHHCDCHNRLQQQQQLNWTPPQAAQPALAH